MTIEKISTPIAEVTDTPKRFGLIGAAGYIAPRHMQAISDTGNDLVAALDPNDSVGVIDSYFPNAEFFVEYERFDRHFDLMRRRGELLDYVAICSPNYLHDAHVRFALRNQANAICEKPLVLNPWNVEALESVEQESGKSVNTILQLRLHPAVIELKERVANAPANEKFDVDLSYITSRGRWYQISWKGNEDKSGGIATNIGVHFFDMLNFVFGELQESALHYRTATTEAGYVEYERARVRWFLSVDAENLPSEIAQKGMRTYRSLKINEEEFEFSGGFTDLHTRSYEKILKGEGFSMRDSYTAIETVADLRNTKPRLSRGEAHPLTWQIGSTDRKNDLELLRASNSDH